MFSRLATLLPVAALVAVASAAGDCSSGGNYCCDQVFTGPASFGQAVGAILVGIGANVGLTCNPIAGIGVSGTSCTTQTACCVNTVTNGLINAECNPINVAV